MNLKFLNLSSLCVTRSNKKIEAHITNLSYLTFSDILFTAMEEV